MRINLAIVTHRYGTTPYVHQTGEGLYGLVTDYCTNEWNKELPKTSIPNGAEEIRQLYFRLVSNESVHYYFEIEVEK
ncbi:hypothetical protein LCGC14_1998760 [marine sediment metagenome]|uniref:Uncharacterized protein n=1 Tax=marine sediment metagenome TaxID=412755 RepID=A0A0F9F431_9ZZZZ